MNLSILKKNKEYLKSSHWFWFIILWSFLQIFLIWYYQTYILSYDSLQKTLGNQLSPVQTDLYFAILQEVTYKVYFLLPVMILIRVLIMALIIHLFLLLTNHYTSLKTIIWVTSLVFGVFIIRDIVQIAVVSGIDNSDPDLLNNIHIPLSLMSLPGLNVNPVLIRLFNQINLFEIFWFGFALLFLWKLTHYSLDKLWLPVLSARIFIIICLWGLGVFYEIYVL